MCNAVSVLLYILSPFRLKQIEMSEYDGELYEKYSENVRPQVKSLRVILETLQVNNVIRKGGSCRRINM